MSAIVHYVRSLYYKQQRDFAEFYKSSLLYLAFISMDSLPEEQKLVRYHAARMRSFLHTHGYPATMSMFLIARTSDKTLLRLVIQISSQIRLTA